MFEKKNENENPFGHIYTDIIIVHKYNTLLLLMFLEKIGNLFALLYILWFLAIRSCLKIALRIKSE